MVRRWIAVLGVVAAACAPARAQDSVKVTASVDADTVGVEDAIQLTVSVSGGASRVDPPDVERALEDFLVVGQSQMSRTSIINFRVSQSRDFIYTILPKKEGVLRIPTLEIVADGKVYRTAPIVITVRPGSKKPSSPQPPQPPWDPWGGSPPFGTSPREQQWLHGPDRNVREGVRIHTEIARPSVYVGEPVVLRYRVLSRYPLLNINVVELPKYENFMVEPIEGDRRLEPKTVSHEGEVFYEVHVFERVLIPTRAGTLSLDPMTLAIEVQSQVSRGFFSIGGFPERVVRRSTEASLDVRPLPQPVPGDFSGAVGEFTLRESLSADHLDVSDALTLTLTLEGRGNVRAMRPPKFPPQTAFTVHDPETRYAATPDARGLRGHAEISYMLLPRAPGRHRVPALPVIVFNPRTEKYESLPTRGGEVTVAGTPRVSVAVRPSEATPLPGAEPRRADIHPIVSASPGLARRDAPLYRRPGALAFWLAAPLVGNAAVAAALALRRRLREDGPARRARGAARDARRRLREAETLLRSGRHDEGARAVEEALLGYVAAKSRRLTAAGIAPSDAAELFRANGVDDSAAGIFLHVLSRAQKARYAADAFAALPPGVVREAEAAIQGIERRWGRRKTLSETAKPWMRRSAMLALALTAWLAHGGTALAEDVAAPPLADDVPSLPPEERFARANVFYENSDFTEAAAGYRSLLRDGFTTPEIYYNLGCAEYKAARLGHAAWAFEMALLLRPGDRRARENLAFVEREAAVDTRFRDESGAEAFLGYLHRLWPLRFSVPALVVALWAACPLWLLYFLRKREGFLYGAAAATSACVLLAALAGAQAAYAGGFLGRGVALDSPVLLRAAPRDSNAAMAEAPAASRLKILDRRGAWVLVSAGAAEGWARAEQVGEIVLP